MKSIFIDLETGGLNPTDPILQISYILDIDGKEESRNIYIQADEKDCDPVALEITGIDPSNPDAIPESQALDILCNDLARHIDVNNKVDNFYLVGYNCQNFDCKFLRALFVRNYKRYNDYFWNPSIDIMLTAAWYCLGQRELLGDFKLVTVAKSLGINVDSDLLHDAMYDVKLTKDIYDVLAKDLAL